MSWESESARTVGEPALPEGDEPMTVLVDVEVPGEPIPAPRPRVSGGRVYMPRRYVEKLDDLRGRFLVDLRRRRQRQRYGGPVRVDVTFSTARAGDVDNRAKTVLDALNGVVIEDDRQLLDLHARMVPARGSPGCHVVVDTIAS